MYSPVPAAARLQTEGVTAVDWEVERGQDHQQTSTACLGPDCPGAGGEEKQDRYRRKSEAKKSWAQANKATAAALQQLRQVRHIHQMRP